MIRDGVTDGGTDGGKRGSVWQILIPSQLSATDGHHTSPESRPQLIQAQLCLCKLIILMVEVNSRLKITGIILS